MDGILAAAVGSDLIIRDPASAGMEIISRGAIEHISLVKMPDDLVIKPTLVWLAQAKRKADDLLCHGERIHLRAGGQL